MPVPTGERGAGIPLLPESESSVRLSSEGQRAAKAGRGNVKRTERPSLTWEQHPGSLATSALHGALGHAPAPGYARRAPGPPRPARLTSAPGLGRRLYDPDVAKPVDLGLRVHGRDFVQQSLALREVVSRAGDEGVTAARQDPETLRGREAARGKHGASASPHSGPVSPLSAVFVRELHQPALLGSALFLS